MSEAKQVAADTGGGLDRLYRRYAVWLHRRLRTRVGPEVAADVVQDTYIRVAPYADQGIEHPKAFLLKVAMNLVRDNHRSEARRDRRIAEASSDDAEAPSQFSQVLLAQVVRDMPQLYRDVFVLSRFNGMTYAGFGDGDSLRSTARVPSDAAAGALQGSVDIPATLRKAQGSEVSIFVAQDLDFTGVYRLRARR